MMFFHCIATVFIYAVLCIPASIISIPAVAVLLLTDWDGRSTIFGNRKWGRANDHPAPESRTSGYWQEFNWFVWRNPVNNLMAIYLALPQRPYIEKGNTEIGDKKAPGFYSVRMGFGWEYYLVYKYSFNPKKCFRLRIGWKIMGNTTDKAAFVFAVTPWKSYEGI